MVRSISESDGRKDGTLAPDRHSRLSVHRAIDTLEVSNLAEPITLLQCKIDKRQDMKSEIVGSQVHTDISSTISTVKKTTPRA